MTDVRPDLHSHSTASDGTLSPLALVERAAAAGITHLAITDHDNFTGADSLRGVETPIPVIPGVELSLKDMRGLHLLGYGLGDAPELRRKVAELAENRRSRARIMVDKLTALGMPLDYEAIAAQAQGSVGRPHIARAMLERGYISRFDEAFTKWIGNDGPAYHEGEKLTMAEALPLMRRSGFIPVLAHPAELEKDDLTLRALMESWQAQGLLGVEVYHPSMIRKGFARLDAVVRGMGLLVTGGSDFHTDGDKHGVLGCVLPGWQRCREDFEALVGAMENAKRA